ncbi:MAG: HAD family hydrolase [Gemmataceae bacterium]
MSAPVVFLDKDGTVVQNRPYNADSERLVMMDGAVVALQSLHEAGWRLDIASNQSGVARGHFPESALQAVEAQLRGVLGELNVPLAGFYYCPHHPDGSVAQYAVPCSCRKPEPGLLLQGCAALEVRPSDCWFVGDSLSDVEAGIRAGMRTILVGADLSIPTDIEPHGRARTLQEAAKIILTSIPSSHLPGSQ